MAYGLKFIHEFYQLKKYVAADSEDTIKWRVEIHQKDYVGSASIVECDKDSIQLSREGDLLDVVQGTKLSISIINETEGQYKELRTADWGEYEVRLYKDPNGAADLYFIGYNQSEIYTEPFNQPPYSSVIEFTCGLNHLKNVKWNESENKVIETGVDSNTNAVSPSVDLTGTAKGAQFKVDYISGTTTNLSIQIQTSPDDVVWTDLGFNVQVHDIGAIANYARLKVVTAEGSASTVNWSITPIYVGQKSIIEVVRLALNKLPNPRSITEFCNIYEDSINSTTTDSMLNQIYVDSSVYKLIDEADEETQFYCSDVLEECLKVFGVNLYQANGNWIIARVQEYDDSTIYYRTFAANKGTESTITVTSTGSYTTNKKTITGPTTADNELILVAPASELSVEPPLNRVIVTYDQTNIDQEESSLIRNGDFGRYTVSNGFQIPDTWVFGVGGSNPATYDCLAVARYNGSDENIFRFNPNTQQTAYLLNVGIYIEQSFQDFNVSTQDALVLKFSFHYRDQIESADYFSKRTPNGSWINNNLIIYFHVEIQFGTYYLAGSPSAGYSWTTTPSNAIFQGVGATVIFDRAIFAGPAGGTTEYFTIDGDYDVNQILPNLPVTGVVDYRVRMFQPYAILNQYTTNDSFFNISGVQSINIRNISLTYLPIELAPTEELVLSTTINDGENLEEISVSHADGTNSATLNSYRLSNGVITDQWTRRGESDDTNILSLFLKQLGILKGDYVRELNTLIIGELEVINTIEQTVGGIVNEYYIKTYNWNIATSEYELTLSEIGNAGVDVTIVTDTFTQSVNLEEPPPKLFDWADGENERTPSITPTQVTPIDTTQRTLNNYV